MSRIQIMFVNEDRGIRESTRLVLSNAGYDVTTTRDAFDALLHLENSPLPALVIFDLNSRHQADSEFLPILRSRYPKVRVLARGQTDELPNLYFDMDEGFQSMEDFRPDVWLKKLSEVLNAALEKRAIESSHSDESTSISVSRTA